MVEPIGQDIEDHLGDPGGPESDDRSDDEIEALEDARADWLYERYRDDTLRGRMRWET